MNAIAVKRKQNDAAINRRPAGLCVHGLGTATGVARMACARRGTFRVPFFLLEKKKPIEKYAGLYRGKRFSENELFLFFSSQGRGSVSLKKNVFSIDDGRRMNACLFFYFYKKREPKGNTQIVKYTEKQTTQKNQQ